MKKHTGKKLVIMPNPNSVGCRYRYKHQAVILARSDGHVMVQVDGPVPFVLSDVELEKNWELITHRPKKRAKNDR